MNHLNMKINLPDYRIGKYPVTNAQYEEFVRETCRSIVPEMGWDGQKIPGGCGEITGQRCNLIRRNCIL